MHVERTDGSYRIADGPLVVGGLVNGFLSHLTVRAFSPLTVRAYAFHVLSFLRFCDERNLALASVTSMDVSISWTGWPRRRRARSSTCEPAGGLQRRQ